MKSRPNAKLQHRIVLRLARPEIVSTVTDLSSDVGASRPSVSRALHALERNHLVVQQVNRWALTQSGREYAEVLRAALPDRTRKLSDEITRRARQNMEAIKVANLGDVSGTKAFQDAIENLNATIAREADGSAESQLAKMDRLGDVISQQFAEQAKIASGLQSLAAQIKTPLETLSTAAASQMAIVEQASAHLSAQLQGSVGAQKLAEEMAAMHQARVDVISQQFAEQAKIASGLQSLAAQIKAPLETLTTAAASHMAIVEQASAHLSAQLQGATGHQKLATEMAAMHQAQVAAAEAHVELFRELAQSAADHWRSAFETLTVRALLPKFDLPWLEEWARTSRVQDAFLVVELVPAPSMDSALIQRVVDAYQTGTSSEEIMGMVLAEYDVDECARTALLVDRLCASEDFADRRPLLEQVLVAHRQGLDAMTVYALVPMIEGVMSSFIFEHGGRVKWPKHNDLAEVLDELPLSIVSAVGWAEYACLVEFFRESLYKNADWKAEDPETRAQHLNLNRHRFLHGLARQGTRAHTLRCLLILETIAMLLPAVRALLAEAADHELAD
jgi:DNA-binding MarR family transcriptional regulator